MAQEFACCKKIGPFQLFTLKFINQLVFIFSKNHLMDCMLSKRPMFLMLGIGGVVSFVLSVSIGSSDVGLWELMKILSGDYGTNIESIFDYRLRRTILATLVGVSLSSSGCAMQSLFRNPLADPYILGVSSGASVGAAVAILTGHGTSPEIIAAAFISSLMAVYAVYSLGKKSTYFLLLAGIAMATFLSGVTSFLIYISGESLRQVLFWIMGGFWTANWTKVKVVLVTAVMGTAVMIFNSWKLNAILLGDEHAMSVGVDVKKLRRVIISTTAFLTAGAVSVSGVIGFVGIIIPHTARLVFGEDNRILIPASILLSAAFMPAVDVVARVSAPGEIPVGIITSLLGAPFFIYLLRRKRYEAQG